MLDARSSRLKPRSKQTRAIKRMTEALCDSAREGGKS